MYNENVNQVSAFDAKTHLSQLLARVQQGNRITITKHNMPIAVLVPFQPKEQEAVEDVIEKILQARKGRKLKQETIQKYKEEGRRS